MPLSRQILVAALLLAGAAGLIYFGADRAARRALDGNAPPTVQRHLDERPTDEELERRRQIYVARITRKERVVQGLLAGHLTLVQAAAKFRDVEEELPLVWLPRTAASGLAEEERLCRVVMDRAIGSTVANHPAQAAEVTARLEAELERHRGPDGAVRLPD